jgi:hypothetical protein
MDHSKKDVKLMNRDQVIEAARAAQKLDLNRKLNVPLLVKELDPQGVNSCSLIMLHDKKNGQPTDLHARCTMHLMLKGRDEAETGILDVPLPIYEGWRSLADIEAEESGQYGSGKATTK